MRHRKSHWMIWGTVSRERGIRSCFGLPQVTTPGQLWTYGKEGEWTRWSNIRNTLWSGTVWKQTSRFDIVHNFGRLALLSLDLAASIPKVQTYMRTSIPGIFDRQSGLERSGCTIPPERGHRDTDGAELERNLQLPPVSSSVSKGQPTAHRSARVSGPIGSLQRRASCDYSCAKPEGPLIIAGTSTTQA